MTVDFHGEVLRPGDAGYEAARLDAMWNGRKSTRRPAAIVRAADQDDVIAAVRWAGTQGWRIGIRSGGHSWIATGVREGALLLDLSALTDIEVDAVRMRVAVQPGAKGSAVYTELGRHGLTYPPGHCRTVSVGGYLLGGGYGWNSRKLGPAALSIEALDVVLADGTLVHADDESHPDLMWAARGAGPGFFGVVTRFYLRARPAYAQILRSFMSFPHELRDEVLAWSYDILPETSASLEIAGKVLWSPEHERPITTLVGVGFVEPDAGADEIYAAFESAPFRDKAIRRFDRVPTSVEELYDFSDLSIPQGRRCAVDGVWTSAPTEQVIAASRPILDSIPPPESFLLWMLWGHYPTQENASWSTQGRLYFSPNAIWTDPAEDLMQEQWAHASLAAFADIDEGTQFSDANPADRPAKGMEAAPAARIEDLRASYDPDGRFVSYLSPPESTTALGRHQLDRG